MRPAVVIACALTLVLAPATRLPADGGFFIKEVGRSEAIAASPRQEALLITDGWTVQVALRAHFRAGPSELAWVVPVPAKPQAVTKGADELFKSLDELTAPRFYRVGSSGLHCGCGSAGSIQAGQPLVAVESSGTAGIFDYTVLSARDPAALGDWLTRNGYRVGGSAPALFDRYVQAGWHWLAMRVRPEAAARGATLAPHPIVYSYPAGPDGELVFPLAISQVSADQSNEVVLYVLASRRYACVNWSNWTFDPGEVGRRSGTTSGTNYAELFAARTRQADGRLFVTEFADDLSNWSLREGAVLGKDHGLDMELIGRLGDRPTLTRLRAIMGPEVMDRDAALAPASGFERVHNRMNVSSVSDWPALAAPLAAVGLLWTGARLTRRKSSWRRPAGAALLLAACLWLATM